MRCRNRIAHAETGLLAVGTVNQVHAEMRSRSSTGVCDRDIAPDEDGDTLRSLRRACLIDVRQQQQTDDIAPAFGETRHEACSKMRQVL